MARPDESRAASATVSAKMLFIVSSNVEKADPVTRKQIRSHVMRGKKRKKYRPDEDNRLSSWGTIASGRIQAAPVKLDELIKTYPCFVPDRIGSDISFVEFADDIQPSLVLKITKFSTVAMKVIFPLLMATGFQADNTEALYPIAVDAAALHITAFAVEGFFDKILRRQKSSGPTAMLHFQKGLRILRERLLGEDDKTKLSDSTISVVLKLASAAHFDGDRKASKQHMEGLRRMVDLRGGIGVFKESRFLTEMLRCDLSIALLNGSSPVLFSQPSEPVIPYPEKLLPADDKKTSQDHTEFLQSIDKDLATGWQVMRRFSLLVDLGSQIQRPVNPKIIPETMTAVMYRLLHMDFAAGSMNGIVRLGLLAFSHHVFLQWQDIRLPYHHFPTTYQNRIMGSKRIEGISSQFMLWLLMTGAVSLFDISDEAWLRECLQDHVDRCEVKTWKEMQEILKSFMWIELLDNEPGKRIFASLRIDNLKALE